MQEYQSVRMGGIDRSINVTSANKIKTGSASLFNCKYRNGIMCEIYSSSLYLIQQVTL